MMKFLILVLRLFKSILFPYTTLFRSIGLISPQVFEFRDQVFEFSYFSLPLRPGVFVVFPVDFYISVSILVFFIYPSQFYFSFFSSLVRFFSMNFQLFQVLIELKLNKS